jgi:hypothetical protein
MASVIKPKRSNTGSSVPTTGNLEDGEIAVNTADKVIYQRVGGSVVAVANYSVGGGGGGTGKTQGQVIAPSLGVV